MKSLCTILLTFIVSVGFCQQKFEKDSVLAFQNRLNTDYKNDKTSPLLAADLKNFVSLAFFDINADFFVNAKFVRTENEVPFEMPTTTDRKPMYVKYGEVYFDLKGKKFKMNVYQSLDLVKIEKYKNNLFLPFTDLTSGNESYGGGRYIELSIPSGNVLSIDFNQAYNPYCAYNYKYSCPIPPKENDLNVAILAGVKKFHD